MRPLDRVRPDDLEHCRALLARGSKSFSLAARLLPRPVRERTTVLYAFCRVSDDRIDDDPSASLATLDVMRERLELAYRGRPYNDDRVDRALVGLLEDTPIPKALPMALLEGMEWDLRGRRYDSLDDLEAYAARVAGTVGAMMTMIMSSSYDSSASMTSEVLARACDLGVAMQLTNIARDVGEDARRGRVYLPLDWLHAERVDVASWLLDPQPTDSVRAVVQRILRSADELYERADHGVAMLPRPCRTAIRAARLIYSDIGRSIQRVGFDSVTRRNRVSTARKLWLLLRSIGAVWARPTPLGAPPLTATQALVAACEPTS